MRLRDAERRAILEAFNRGRGELPPAHTVQARPNRRTLISVTGRRVEMRLNLADVVVRAGPEAWELIGPTLNGDKDAGRRLRSLVGHVRRKEGPRERRGASAKRRNGNSPLPDTPCEGTPHERWLLVTMIQWVREVSGWGHLFPESLQIRVSRRMRRGLGSCRIRGGVARITISSRLLRAGLEDIALDTVLHECAHLLHALNEGGGRSDHGPEWKRWCRRLGAHPERLASGDEEQRVERANEDPKPMGLPKPVERWCGQVDADSSQNR